MFPKIITIYSFRSCSKRLTIASVRLTARRTASTFSSRQIYQPLDPAKREIRVLRLHPGSEDDTVSGTLHVKSLAGLKLNLLRERDEISTTRKEIFATGKQLSEEQERLVERLVAASKAKDYRQASDAADVATPIPQDESVKRLVQRFRHQKSRSEELLSRAEDWSRRLGEYSKATGALKVWTVCSPAEPPKRIEASSGEYEAISYCWSSSGEKTEIILNGHPFLAPSSAVNVLRNLRSDDREKSYWIDGLCINQDDPAEREDQVSRMGDIYTAATQTRIWLGELDSNTALAFGLCKAIGDQLVQRLSTNSTEDPKFLFNDIREEINKIPLPPGFSMDKVSPILEALFGRRWFSRMWVYQEARLSSNAYFYSGSLCLPWTYLSLTAMRFIDVSAAQRTSDSESAYWGMHFARQLLQLYLNSSVQEAESTWSSAFDSTRLLEAGDMRDKIYALLSTIPERGEGGSRQRSLRPNYRDSLRISMRDATRAVLEEEISDMSGSLDLLAVNADRYPRSQNNPYKTWPSWSLRFDTALCGPVKELEETCRAADGKSPASDITAIATRPDVLLLQGYRIGSVSRSANQAHCETWRSLFHHLLDNYASHLSPREILSSVLSLITPGRGLLIKDALDLLKCPVSSKDKLRLVLPRIGESFGMKLMYPSERPGKEDGVPTICIGRRWFLVEHHGRLRLGLGPEPLENGDIVAIVFGSKWPWVLRPDDQGYRLIGPCFIDGFMKGEAVRAYGAKGTKPDMFEIA